MQNLSEGGHVVPWHSPNKQLLQERTEKKNETKQPVQFAGHLDKKDYTMDG